MYCYKNIPSAFFQEDFNFDGKHFSSNLGNMKEI